MKKFLKWVGIVVVVALLVPCIELLFSLIAGTFAGAVALACAAPMVVIPILVIGLVFVFVHYFIVKWVVGKFHH